MKYFYTIKAINKNGVVIYKNEAQDRLMLKIIKQFIYLNYNATTIIKRHTITKAEWKARFC